MSGPRGNETRAGQVPSAGTNFSRNQNDRSDDSITDSDLEMNKKTDSFNDGYPRPPEYVQAAHKNKNTVKELLMMRRQKWSRLQDDNNLEHTLKFAKPDAFADDAIPRPSGPPAPVNYNVTSNRPPTRPENSPHVTPQQMHHPAVQGPAAWPAEVKMTLFHWQIQQEAQRIGGLSPELLNTQDADGDTFLHIAVAQGRRALAYALATKMARCGSLDTKEHNGQTALQIATATNQHLIVHDLLAHGAQINTRDLWGRSPLHVCAEKGHFFSLESIRRTLLRSRRPIDIEMFNYDGLTPLHAAVLSHNRVVKEQRSPVNSRSHAAAELAQRREAYVECIKTLLLMGASFGTKDRKSGRTCLHMASEEANVELFNIFFEQPSLMTFVNVKTFGGNTALHVVSSLRNRKAQAEAAKLLMRKGADPGMRNFENELPSQLVPDGPLGEKVRLILKGKYVHA